MRFLTAAQSAAWAGEHGYVFAVAGANARLDRTSFQTHRFEIPTDAGRRIALCRMLWEAMVPDHAEALLWATEWGVWPSGEHMPLVTALRQAHGESRPLIAAPGLLLQSSETESAFSFLAVYALFLWDCYILVPSGESGFFLSHDEFGRVFGRSHDASIALRGRLTTLGVEIAPDPND